MKALRRPRVEVDLGEIGSVGIQNINRAKLVEFASAEVTQAVVERPWRDVDILRADEVSDAGTLMALLDLVPPALALVLHHRGLFDEDACRGAEQVEQRAVCSGYGGKEFPTREDRCFAGSRGDMCL